MARNQAADTSKVGELPVSPYSKRWLTLILLVSILSTILSGTFFVIGVKTVRWSHIIGTQGAISASGATVLSQLLAKSLETSLVALFLIYLGQWLSLRASTSKVDAGGINLAQLSMRNWIIQPGTIITSFKSVRIMGLKCMGIVSLVVATTALLYTTAASALVTPSLENSAWQDATLTGIVKTPFANPTYMNNRCSTPIAVNHFDPDYTASTIGQTCLTLKWAAVGFFNYVHFLAAWTNVKASENGTTHQEQRVVPSYVEDGNITTYGSWSRLHTVEQDSQEHQRVVDNITLILPHAGVPAAARRTHSVLVQPEELGDLGTFTVRAAVPSPYLNVLCTHATSQELSSVVYSLIAKNVTLNITADLPVEYTSRINWTDFKRQESPLDEIFEWSLDRNRRPLFYKLPTAFNTILNNTVPWPSPDVYLLGKGGSNMDSTRRGEYLLCRVRGGLLPTCATEFIAGKSFGSLRSECSRSEFADTFYNARNSSRSTTVSSDFVNVLITAMNALSLNNGVTDGGASNARVLMQLMLQQRSLNPNMPSPAEALAVMVGNSVYESSRDSSFLEYWKLAETELSPGEPESFFAKVRSLQYTSGGGASYQKGFAVILLFGFLINLGMLYSFLRNRRLVVDVSDPLTLFTLATNSPSCPALIESQNSLSTAARGLNRDQLMINWRVKREDDELIVLGNDDDTGSDQAPDQSSLKRRNAKGRRWNRWRRTTSSDESALKSLAQVEEQAIRPSSEEPSLQEDVQTPSG